MTIINTNAQPFQVLFKRVLKGEIPPRDLVRLSAEELASKELAAWRQRENRHVIITHYYRFWTKICPVFEFFLIYPSISKIFTVFHCKFFLQTIEMIEKEQREVERRPVTKITHKGEIEIENQEPAKAPEALVRLNELLLCPIV